MLLPLVERLVVLAVEIHPVPPVGHVGVGDGDPARFHVQNGVDFNVVQISIKTVHIVNISNPNIIQRVSVCSYHIFVILVPSL